jgi:hypothetical protein
VMIAEARIISPSSDLLSSLSLALVVIQRSFSDPMEEISWLALLSFF